MGQGFDLDHEIKDFSKGSEDWINWSIRGLRSRFRSSTLLPFFF